MFEPVREWISPEAYLTFEAEAEGKHEYFNGEIFAMAGAEPEHNLIAGNVLRELGNQLEEGPCRAYPSDQRVKIPDTGLYTYPDVTIVCDKPEYEPARPRSLLNPTLIVEVLFETTEAYDRGDKFDHYQTLDSLREYVLIASDGKRIERFERQAGSAEWTYSQCSDEAGGVPLSSIGCALTLSRVYAKVEFPERASRRRRRPS